MAPHSVAGRLQWFAAAEHVARFLIHDGTIFDGADERKRALAPELAASKSKAHRFQYVCRLNSDYVQ